MQVFKENLRDRNVTTVTKSAHRRNQREIKRQPYSSKDFFDVYQLFTNHEIDKKLLAEAIVGTFKNRNTPYRENLALFTDKFATDATRNIWWIAFLKKIRWKEQIDFSVVMKCIKENLQVYWNKEILG